MKRSIVWRCAVTVALTQIGSGLILGTIAVATGTRPVFNAWAERAADTLRRDQQLLRNIADQQGREAASSAAATLSGTDVRHRVIYQSGLESGTEYLSLLGEEWRTLAETEKGPSWRKGALRWATYPAASKDEPSVGEQVVVLSSAQWPVTQVIRSNPVRNVVWIASGLLLSALAGGLIATWFTGPILRLRGSVSRFASGELDSRPLPRLQSRTDEIGELARDLAHMQDRIAALIGAQRELLDDVAHELRSPLARMNIAIELAENACGSQQEPSDVEQAHRMFQRMRRECEQLASMVNRLLTLSALENELEDDNRAEVSLNRLVAEVVRDCDFEARATDRRVDLHAELEIRVLGNEGMLRSAIENIVRNAIRYTPTGQTVEISVLTEAGDLDRGLIIFRDHGPGVSADALPNLFQPFFRVESDRSKESGGAGLGLALADRAVRVHAGEITARNHADGGLEVTITLPTCRVGG